jgi:predicted TIM-barrel enzyme
VLTGAVLSAEGVLTGCADETHRVRGASGATPSIWADVYEPTSRPLLPDDFDAAVVDALDFGLADAVIVTGSTATGTLDLARRVRRSRPGARVVIGGRIDASTVAEALSCADTVIIGSALKAVPGIRGPVDPAAARSIATAARESAVTESAVTESAVTESEVGG